MQFDQRALGQRRHAFGAIGRHVHQAFGSQLHQRLAQGDGADAQMRGEFRILDDDARLQCAGEDVVTQANDRLPAQGR